MNLMGCLVQEKVRKRKKMRKKRKKRKGKREKKKKKKKKEKTFFCNIFFTLSNKTWSKLQGLENTVNP